MSRSTTNSLTRGYSGKFGEDYVLRRKNGKSLMTKIPDRSKTELTPAQKAVVNRFKLASEFAAERMRDPVMKEEYRLAANGASSAYVMAMRDYFKPPSVDVINTNHYEGHSGDFIRIEALDVFRVVDVKLTISDQNGTILESGHCVHLGQGAEWEYSVQQEHLPLPGQVISVVAYDTPDHTGQATVTL